MPVIRMVGKIISSILTIVLILLLVANIYTIAARHITGEPQPAVFGWSWAVVISGSMEPEINVNDLIIVHEQDDYFIGDIVAYDSGSSVVTHRIVDETEQGFITKGDFNNAADMLPVPKPSIIGQVVHIIPGAGWIIDCLRSPLGLTCLVIIGFLLLEIPQLINRHRGK